MNSNRPYFLRAVNEWIMDNNMTPHLLIDATVDGVQVPKQHIDDGKIILNISPSAIHEAQFGNDWILFSARFSGVLFRIELPLESVIAIYAKENGRGMVFPDEPQTEAGAASELQDKLHNDVTLRQSSQAADDKPGDGDKPHLTVIK